MAFVFKHFKSRFWFAGYSDERGVRVNRSTRETDRRKAQQIADGWEHACRLARQGVLTTDKAREVVSEILERITDGAETIRSEPTDAYLRRWLAGKGAKNSEATAERYRSTVEKFITHMGARASRPLTAIRVADLDSFVTARAKLRSTKTVSVDLKTLAAAFASAYRQGLISRNPALGVEVAKVKSKERQPFTVEQVRALLAAASGDWKTCILAAYTTGARLSDVVGMRWADLDMAEGVWTYVQGKTDEKTVTPLHPDLHAHLEGIAGDEPAEFVMPSLAGQGTGGCNGLSIQFSKIMRAAGIAQDREDQKSGRTFAALSFHSLRHSFESHLANAGVSAETRRELAGRADEAVQRGYTHLETEMMRQAVAKLPSVVT